MSNVKCQMSMIVTVLKGPVEALERCSSRKAFITDLSKRLMHIYTWMWDIRNCRNHTTIEISNMADAFVRLLHGDG